MLYSIDGKPAWLSLSGKFVEGEAVCLLDGDDDLTADCSWHNNGYIVASMLDMQVFESLRCGVEQLLCEALSKAAGRPDNNFSLERYHRYCPDQPTHLRVIEFLRSQASLDNLPVDYRLLDQRVSERCGKPVSCNARNQIAAGYFFVRLVRPQPCHDNNPPHKDAWLDRLRHGLNLYLPLAGSDENSSLALTPGSHLWKESSIPRTLPGAEANGVAFSVPSVAMPDGALEMVRPAVDRGQGLLFSPYLIHGGAVNFNTDCTRVSLEMRFWRKVS